ncbi:MAG: tRNA preQ1(34) S-adenosylmethionine ribosyltransferase-isomerase QueA [Kiritimatiellia bacterium]|jgi:S-adenosylmethionine:tRNA ribosyltransferase-isomerase
MLTSDFDYDLPAELIAQEPPAVRGDSRMLVLDRATGGIVHSHIRDLHRWLNPGDLLVMNDTRVFPARLQGNWEDTRGRIELLLVEPVDASGEVHPGDVRGDEDCWICLCGSGRPPRTGQSAVFVDGAIRAEILETREGGSVVARFHADAPLLDVLSRFGAVPVPPYIRREGNDRARAVLDRERYQTVYAAHTGAVAAPTAGLHFTPELLDDLATRGVPHAFVTLHVGPGTFKPVKSETVEEHAIDPERFDVPASTADAVRACRAAGGRVVAVGSTSVRTLETMARLPGAPCACSGRSGLYVYPPFEFRCVDRMLTNFHLPKSSLLMMVSALAGRETVLAAYREAVRERYRFFSYGDCMLVR